LKKLAESDVMESVREVQEFYADYIPVGPSFFTLNIKGYAEGLCKIKVTKGNLNNVNFMFEK